MAYQKLSTPYHLIQWRFGCWQMKWPRWFNSRCEAEFQGEHYLLVTKRWFSSEIVILDPNTEHQKGSVSFNFWQNKAVLRMNDGFWMSFRFTNFWQNKWQWHRDGSSWIDFKDKPFSQNGYADILQQERYTALLLLLGIYLRSHLTAVAAFIGDMHCNNY